MRWLLALIATALPAFADGEPAGEFDYYVLALSWSPAYCALEGDDRGDDQCDPRHDHGFTLHGLWPQYEFGWPSYCRTGVRDPARSETAAMADIMGSGGLAWHQWKKHGRCTGLSSNDYFQTARKAYGRVAMPEVFARVRQSLKVDARVIEEAFLDANPEAGATGITVTCEAGLIREVRICLDKNLDFRPCGPDAARDCRMSGALLEPVR